MACASIVRLMRVSAPRQTRSDACVIDGREPGWFLQGKPPGIWLGLDPEHFGTVLGRKEGGAATTGEGRRRHRPIPHGCDGHAGYSVHGHVTAARRPAVDDRDANTLGWCEQRRKGIRRHLDLERSRAADVGLKHLKPSEPF